MTTTEKIKFAKHLIFYGADIQESELLSCMLNNRRSTDVNVAKFILNEYLRKDKDILNTFRCGDILRLYVDDRNIDMVEWLLARGANPNLSGYGYLVSPLFISAAQGHAAMVELLLRFKACMEFRGKHILEYVMERCFEMSSQIIDCANILIQHGARVVHEAILGKALHSPEKTLFLLRHYPAKDFTSVLQTKFSNSNFVNLITPLAAERETAAVYSVWNVLVEESKRSEKEEASDLFDIMMQQTMDEDEDGDGDDVVILTNDSPLPLRILQAYTIRSCELTLHECKK